MDRNAMTAMYKPRKWWLIEYNGDEITPLMREANTKHGIEMMMTQKCNGVEESLPRWRGVLYTSKRKTGNHLQKLIGEMGDCRPLIMPMNKWYVDHMLDIMECPQYRGTYSNGTLNGHLHYVHGKYELSRSIVQNVWACDQNYRLRYPHLHNEYHGIKPNVPPSRDPGAMECSHREWYAKQRERQERLWHYLNGTK